MYISAYVRKRLVPDDGRKCSGFYSDTWGFCFLEATTTDQKTKEQFFARHFWRSSAENMALLPVKLMLT